MNKRLQRGRESRGADVPLHSDAGIEREDAEPEAAGILLGRRITKIRTQQRLSQRELDKLAGFGHGWVSALEAGHVKNPGIDSIYKLVAALGVPITRLLVDDLSDTAPVSSERGTPGEISEDANVLLQELYNGIFAILKRDPGRIAALRVLVRDMQAQTQLESVAMPSQREAPGAT
jgi:transcriptional regulator with XRE-family HTH domain